MPEAEEQRCWNHRLVNLLTQVADTSARWGRVDYLVNNAFSFIAAGLAAQREEWSAACGWDRWLGPEGLRVKPRPYPAAARTGTSRRVRRSVTNYTSILS